MSRNNLFVLPVTVFVILITLHTADAQKIYWTQGYLLPKMQRVNVDGSNIEIILEHNMIRNPSGIAIDTQSRKMYWTSSLYKVIKRSNLDGSQIEILVSNDLIRPFRITLDIEHGKMYWTNGTGNQNSGIIQCSNLDGTNIKTLNKSESLSAGDIVLDINANKMYWIDGLLDTIVRANLDGTEVELLHTIDQNSSGIAIDLVERKIYWTVDNGSHNPGKILRANLDGTQSETLISNNSIEPNDITVDNINRKLYWMNDRFPVKGIQRSNLDGTNIEYIIDLGTSSHGGIALDDTNGMVYWTNRSLDTIFRADLDGSHIKDVLPNKIISPHAIIVDGDTNILYWTDSQIPHRGENSIRKINLLTNIVEDVITDGYAIARTLAYDNVEKNIYWIDHNTNGIIKSNVFGSNIEIIHEGNNDNRPIFLVINHISRKLYWIVDKYEGGYSIQRSNINGSNIEEIYNYHSGETLGFAIDLVNNKLYWSESYRFPENPARIVQSNLDGSDVNRNFITDLFRPGNITVDTNSNKIYWVDLALSNIQRANLDGSMVEDFIVGLERPSGITIDTVLNDIAQLDIKPGSCPNTMNTKSRGKIPVAIAGSDEFDVSDIDIDTIVLRRTDGVGEAIKPAAKKSGRFTTIEDVSTSFDSVPCDCLHLDGDGIDDLTLKFSSSEMTRAFELATLPARTELVLTLTGSLNNGRSFTASDCIQFVGHQRGELQETFEQKIRD